MQRVQQGSQVTPKPQPLCVPAIQPILKTPVALSAQSRLRQQQVQQSPQAPPRPQLNYQSGAPKYLYPPSSIKLGWTKQYPVGSGMKNQGNTCYINAALQALFHIPAFVSLVLEDQRHRDNCTLKKNNTCLMCSVAETLIRSHQSSLVVPVRIYNQLPITCLNCKGVSKSIQSISDLNVVLQDSVLQAISVYFQPSKLVGYKCQNCRSQSGAYKASSIINPPNVLVITLNRFQAQTGAKINSPCKVDPTLDLKKFYKGNKDGCRYKFLACVNHHGPGAKRGHYTCLAVAANGSTYEFDDEKKITSAPPSGSRVRLSIAMDDDQDEFEDACEDLSEGELEDSHLYHPSGQDLESALLDARKSINYFFNNQFDEARLTLKAYQDTSLYHSLGSSVFCFLEAMLTFRAKHIKAASAALKTCVNVCDQHRRKNSMVETIGKMVKRPNYNSYTTMEIHAELCYAEALLLKSILTFVEDETLVTFLKAGLKIRSCFNSYKECAEILKNRDWTDDPHK
ncbi:hypothetical protein FOCC_FOCC004825, partial [Frankliniella occidentalis]